MFWINNEQFWFNYLLQRIISSCQNPIPTPIYDLDRVFWYRAIKIKVTTLGFWPLKVSPISKLSIKPMTIFCTSRTTEMQSSKFCLLVISKSTMSCTRPKSKTKETSKPLTSPYSRLEQSHNKRNSISPSIAKRTL